MIYLKDFFLTDQLFIRGHVRTGGSRLATLLNSPSRHFVEVEDATCSDRAGGTFLAPQLMLQVSQILMAHEAMEAGDDGWRALAGSDNEMLPVAIHLCARENLKVETCIKRSVYQREGLGERRFLAVQKPRINGGEGFKALASRFPAEIPYAILNRERILLIHEFR